MLSYLLCSFEVRILVSPMEFCSRRLLFAIVCMFLFDSRILHYLKRHDQKRNARLHSLYHEWIQQNLLHSAKYRQIIISMTL
jgi:hypothetical protein